MPAITVSIDCELHETLQRLGAAVHDREDLQAFLLGRVTNLGEGGIRTTPQILPGEVQGRRFLGSHVFELFAVRQGDGFTPPRPSVRGLPARSKTAFAETHRV
jgi:hypothetical protein